MDVFSQIDGALAIVRYPKGVFKQVKLYHRKTRVYIPHAGGFILVRGQDICSDAYFTSHPDIKLIEYDAPGVESVKEFGAANLRWTKG